MAELYGVPTREVNRAVKNNPEKFLKGYVIELNTRELSSLRWKNSTTNTAKRRSMPKAFTEKGLYMLATIIKSKQATQATLQIVETFTKVREFKISYVKSVEKIIGVTGLLLQMVKNIIIVKVAVKKEPKIIQQEKLILLVIILKNNGFIS